MAQERLWITEPRRATCLAEVTQVRGDRFTVDKALFAPRSSACRHPQNHDEGTIWIDGEKRRLATVVDEAGTVWYGLRGTTPPVGATLQCELDQEVRGLASRAHTSMHLWIAALPADAPPMVTHPEVKGGGHFRITYAWPIGPDVLAATLQRVEQAIAGDEVVQRRYVSRAEAEHVMAPQSFRPPDPSPGPDPLPLVQVGGVAYPCDGSHVDRTSRIDRLVISHAAQGKDGFVVGGRVMGRA